MSRSSCGARRRQALEVETDRHREDRPPHGPEAAQPLLDLWAHAQPDRPVREELIRRVARARVAKALDQVDDRRRRVHAARRRQRAPVHAGEEQHIRIDGVLDRYHRLAQSRPRVAVIPQRVRREADPCLIRRRAAHVLEVVKDLQVTALESLEVPVKGNGAHRRGTVARGRRVLHRSSVRARLSRGPHSPTALRGRDRGTRSKPRPQA